MLGHIHVTVHHHTVQAFVEEEVGAGLDLFPGGEFAGFLVAAQAGVVLGRLFRSYNFV